MVIKKRIFGLDLIRAIAISLVVLSHCTFLVFPNSESFVITAVRLLGAIGVDIFFVLSGYLIGGIILKHMQKNEFGFLDLLRFWKRRWFRTLPNYFLILIINIILGFLLINELPERIYSYFLFLQNFSSPHPDFFTEAWSLSVEEYAYLILPLLIFASIRISRTNKEKVFFQITLLSIFLLFILKMYYFFNIEINTYKDWSSSFRKVVIYRIDSIYFGFILIYLFRKYTTQILKIKYLLFIIGVMIFGGIHALMFRLNILPQTNAFFYVFIYLQVVILSISLMFPIVVDIKYDGVLKQLVEYVSTRSYAIYLINYSIVLLSLKYIIQKENLSMGILAFYVSVFLLVTIVLSEIVYRYFEKPILNYRDKKYKN